MAKALFLEDLPIIGKYVRDLLANKVDKVEGKSLSTNDYTTEEKTKLEGLSNDYDDLTDKPSINGVTLSGNKTTEDLIPIGDGLDFNASGGLEVSNNTQVIVNTNALQYERKNLLKMTFDEVKRLNTLGSWSNNEYTLNGVKYTVYTNESGSVTSITANGEPPEGSQSIFVAALSIIPSSVSGLNPTYIASGAPDGGGENKYYVEINTGQFIYDNFDHEVDIVNHSINYKLIVKGNINKYFYPMVRIAGDDAFEPYKPSINERINALENDKIATLTTSCSCSATDHDNVGTFTASFSYADIKAKGIDIDNTNNGFNIIKYIFWKEQTVDGKTYKLSFPDGMETFKIENISMSYNFDGEKISSIDFEGIYKPQESVDAPNNYMNLDIILVNR